MLTSNPMADAVLALSQHGYVASHSYGDGVLRMAKPTASGDEAVAWIDADGMRRPPALMSDYRAVITGRTARQRLELSGSIRLIDMSAR